MKDALPIRIVNTLIVTDDKGNAVSALPIYSADDEITTDEFGNAADALLVTEEIV